MGCINYITEHSTFALSGESYNVRLFGRQKKYYLFRMRGAVCVFKDDDYKEKSSSLANQQEF